MVSKPWETPPPRTIPELWMVRELESTQLHVLETPALVAIDEHLPIDEKAEPWKYPAEPPAGYRVEWTAVCVGSEENLCAIAEALDKAEFRMF